MRVLASFCLLRCPKEAADPKILGQKVSKMSDLAQKVPRFVKNGPKVAQKYLKESKEYPKVSKKSSRVPKSDLKCLSWPQKYPKSA